MPAKTEKPAHMTEPAWYGQFDINWGVAFTVTTGPDTGLTLADLRSRIERALTAEGIRVGYVSVSKRRDRQTRSAERQYRAAIAKAEGK